MHSRWILRSFVLAAALMLALPVVASAQTSRVEGMALQGDYIKDYTNIYQFPSCIPVVGNFAYGELGNFLINPVTGNPLTTDRSVGVLMDKLWDGKLGTWGIHLRQETPALGQGDAFSQPGPGFGGDPNSHVNESFDVMWGKKSGTTNIGLRINRSFWKFEDTVPGVTTTLDFGFPATLLSPTGDPNLSRNILGVSGGIGFEMNSTTNAEIAALWQSRSFENSTVGPGAAIARNEDNGTSTYMIAGRMMWQWQPNVMVVPVFKWYSFDLARQTTTSPPSPPTVNSFDNSLKGWQLGAAGNWTLGTNDLLVLGLTVAQNKVEQQEDLFGISGSSGLGDTLEVTELLAPQVFAALETHINHWLTLRFGAHKGAYQKIKAEDQGIANEKQEVTFGSFGMNIGAGVKIGGLQLDAILDNDFPQNIGNLLTNAGGGPQAFPKVTATYPF